MKKSSKNKRIENIAEKALDVRLLDYLRELRKKLEAIKLKIVSIHTNSF